MGLTALQVGEPGPVCGVPPEAAVANRGYGGYPGATPEARARQRFEWEQQQNQNMKSLQSEISRRLDNAYRRGVASATDEQARSAYVWRGFVLLLVVLAVVSMPILAILIDLEPTDFGNYIAPVTGIAGTVVGYWFGQAGREQGQHSQGSI
jgi:hypothetical protein